MKSKKDVKVQGLVCTIEDSSCKPYLECKTMKYGMKFVGPNRGEMGYVPHIEKAYKSATKKGIRVGLGAVMWLNSVSKGIRFRVTEIDPARVSIREPLLIPEVMESSPKFKVNGQERFYFFEALRACFAKPQGMVKLPTGTGKTEIELTLAHNQSKYIGTGMILVPTVAIKTQFLERAKIYGIPLIDYKDFNEASPDGTVFICSHHTFVPKFKDALKKKEALANLSKVLWIILDEAHHVSCKTWIDILYSLKNCHRLHGFSASPTLKDTSKAEAFNELDQKDVKRVAMLGPMIYERSANELKDFLNLPDMINIPYTWPEDFHEDQHAKDMHGINAVLKLNTERVEFISSIFGYLVQQGYKVATFVKEKNLARQILAACNNPKIACWFGQEVCFGIKGDIKLKEFKKGFGINHLGVILTSHGIEGLDFSSPLNVLLVHEGESAIQAIQKVGRTVRPDIKPSLVINICDKGCNILPKHSVSRTRDISAEFMCSPIYCPDMPALQQELLKLELRRGQNGQ